MNNKKKVVNLDMKQYGMFLALIAIYVIFAIMTGGKNLSPANINNLIMQNGYVVILAIGMLLCVLTGNVDLGVGSVVALTGASAGIIMVDYKMNMWVAIFVALLIGLLSRLTDKPLQIDTANASIDSPTAITILSSFEKPKLSRNF